MSPFPLVLYGVSVLVKISVLLEESQEDPSLLVMSTLRKAHRPAFVRGRDLAAGRSPPGPGTAGLGGWLLRKKETPAPKERHSGLALRPLQQGCAQHLPRQRDLGFPSDIPVCLACRTQT